MLFYLVPSEEQGSALLLLESVWPTAANWLTRILEADVCGIGGIYNLTDSREGFPSESHVARMVASMRHRGPDSAGTYVEKPIALGASRLAIIDLSHAADQPMVVGDYVLVFDGEIYNYLELKEELEKQGTIFTTQSDTEVLLRLYMKEGTACLDSLRGMFAFAIWNRADETLFLARDRLGEKPIVYYHDNGVFAFASEINALLTLPDVPRRIDPIGLHYGLYYVAVPAPYSAFEHIRKLRPASYMIVSRGGVRTERYWRLRCSRYDLITDANECVQEINRCLDETVRIMCRSDAPLGAMLSGGMDSSAVVAAMPRELDSPDTFCLSYETNEKNCEFHASRKVARRYNTRHHETTFTRDHISVVPEVVRSYGEPVGSFVPLHAHVLSSFIKETVTVVLTGSGGDELFGGYADHRWLLKCEERLRQWSLLDNWRIGSLAGLCPVPGIRRSWTEYSALRNIPSKRLAAARRFRNACSFYQSIYSRKMKDIIGDCDTASLLVEAYEDCGATNLLDGFMCQLLMVASQHGIVDIPDISGMANSLEYRSPFLDVKMVELAMRIPGHLKVKRQLRKSGGKWILRESMRDRLPEEILSMKKAHFGCSIAYPALALRDWSGFVLEKLSSPALIDSGLFEVERLRSMYELAQNGHDISIGRIWGIAMVAQWLEEYF